MWTPRFFLLYQWLLLGRGDYGVDVAMRSTTASTAIPVTSSTAMDSAPKTGECDTSSRTIQHPSYLQRILSSLLRWRQLCTQKSGDACANVESFSAVQSLSFFSEPRGLFLPCD